MAQALIGAAGSKSRSNRIRNTSCSNNSSSNSSNNSSGRNSNSNNNNNNNNSRNPFRNGNNCNNNNNTNGNHNNNNNNNNRGQNCCNNRDKSAGGLVQDMESTNGPCWFGDISRPSTRARRARQHLQTLPLSRARARRHDEAAVEAPAQTTPRSLTIGL